MENVDKRLTGVKTINSHMWLRSCYKTKPNISIGTTDLLMAYGTQHSGDSMFMKLDTASLLKDFDIHMQS